MKQKFLKAAANSHKYPAAPRENVRNEGMVVCWLRPGDDKEEEEVEEEEQAFGTRLILSVNRCRYSLSRVGTSVSGTHSQESTSREPKYSVASV